MAYVALVHGAAETALAGAKAEQYFQVGHALWPCVSPPGPGSCRLWPEANGEPLHSIGGAPLCFKETLYSIIVETYIYYYSTSFNLDLLMIY